MTKEKPKHWPPPTPPTAAEKEGAEPVYVFPPKPSQVNKEATK